MIVREIVFIIVFMLSIPFPLYSKMRYTGKEKATLVETRETKNCFVSYVMIKGKKYLVKQKKEFKKQLAVIRDALAAWIAKDLKIAHQVDIIPYKDNFPGKIQINWPATLHTLAAGSTVREQLDCKYNELRLRQFWACASTLGEKGLTRAIITYMTWHRQLPVIVALDLLIGNSDRHCGNLCYDPKTDTFCAIDMDDTFNKDLCELASQKLIFIMEQDTAPFTRQEIAALISMRDTLGFLVHKHKPKEIIAKLYFFAKKAGFSKGDKMYDERVEKKLLFYENTIKATDISARKLIVMLDKIIAYKSRQLESVEVS